MNTECPNCKTLFRVRQEQLDAARGKVRCGDCLAVFNALESLRDDAGGALAAAPAQKAAVVGTDKKKRVPKLTPESKPAPQPANAPKPVASAPASSDAATDAVHEHSLPFSAFATTRRSTRGWSVLSAFFLLALVGQYLWFNRAALLANPSLRPMAESVCKVAGCQLAPPKDASAFELTGLGVQTHPSYQGALLVDATFVNRSDKSLAHPDVELVFTDTENTPLFSRRFSPEKYLGKKPQQLVAPGAETHVVLELLDPGDLAVGYEFRFF